MDWYGKVSVGRDSICIGSKEGFYTRQQQQILAGDAGTDGAAHSGDGKVGNQHGGRARNDVNTVCRWVRDYRRKHGMPSYAEAKGIVRREERLDLQ